MVKALSGKLFCMLKGLDTNSKEHLVGHPVSFPGNETVKWTYFDRKKTLLQKNQILSLKFILIERGGKTENCRVASPENESI